TAAETEDEPPESGELPVPYARLTAARLGELIRAPEVASDDGGWLVECCLQYGDALARGRFRVRPDGAMELLEDTPLVAGIPAMPSRNAPPRSLRLGSRRARSLKPL